MAARAKEKGLAVDAADLFAWLDGRPDGSLGGLTAFQVVEHLAPSQVFDLVELAARKLAPGGRVLLESVNPESLYAMRWFWMDLTHVRPVPAPSLAQLLKANGFKDVRVDFRSPVPEGEGLPADAAKDPRLAPVARLLFAPQDYAVTGVK
jgi:O-antigen chain-terminating methyltransferase